jgi:hypothetical protein
MTAAAAHAAIQSIAGELLAVEDRLRRVWEAAPRSPDEDVMFKGRKAWDLAMEVRTVVECVGKDLRRVVEPLERVSRISNGGLRRDSG